MTRKLWTLMLMAFAAPAAAVGASEKDDAAVIPLPSAHAHNDYAHRRPLADALAQGFCSVEADIFRVDDDLLVGHHAIELRRERTLESLYLKPLAARVKQNGGQVYPGGGEFTLLIDIKSDGRRTYEQLAKVLARYSEMLTTSRDGKLEKNAVTVVISGNRDSAAIGADKVRYASIDGRLGDLDSGASPAEIPLISDNWKNHFTWRGDGPMPGGERDKLHKIVRTAHQRHRRVRFWATPDKPSVWKELQAAGVDHINTDNLAGLATFLRKSRAGEAKNP